MSDLAVIEELNRWSEMLLDLGLVEDWQEGAIFPREMAFFMARCRSAGVRQVIESGRQDGYSTRILGEFAKRTGTKIVSIDYESEKERGERCRKMLADLPIELLVGDAFEEIGKVLNGNSSITAILIDGPKNWGAVSLLCASAGFPQVTILSMHNLDEGYITRRFFADLTPEHVYYEAYLEGRGGDAWQRLCDAEVALISKRGAARGGKLSTIGVLDVAKADRRHLANISSAYFRTYPPRFIRWAWRTGNYGLLKFVFAATNRWLGGEHYRE